LIKDLVFLSLVPYKLFIELVIVGMFLPVPLIFMGDPGLNKLVYLWG